MPVENGGTYFPQPNVQFESPAGPLTVEADDGTSHTGVVEPESSPVTVDHSEMHRADSTGQFESPGPETVRVEGFDAPDQQTPAGAEAPGPEPDGSPAPVELETPKEDNTVQPSPDPAAADPVGRHEAPAAAPAAVDPKLISTASVQAKVVKPAESPAPAGTSGAEVK